MDFSSGVGLSASPIGGTPLGTATLSTPTAAIAESAAVVPAGAYVADMPYTPLQVTGLISCFVVLMLCGMMMFDMVHNMWSWEGNYSANSTLMDMILKWF